MIGLLERFGFDIVLIETVGAGQRGRSHSVAWPTVPSLLVQPEAGDDLQWEKAGIVEMADIVVVHKADLPSAERVSRSCANF